MTDCIFCEIVAGQAPATIVYEDDLVMAFLPLDSAATGHTLLIPKVHAVTLFELEENILNYLIQISKQLGADLMEQHQATGLNLLNASGKAAQQSVFHFHFHLIPRTVEDGLDLWFI